MKRKRARNVRVFVMGARQLTRDAREPKILYSAAMRDMAAEVKKALEGTLRRVPGPFALGRRLFFPPDIRPGGRGRGKGINGPSAGQDGRGGAVRLPGLVSAFGGLADQDLSQALLYSPSKGFPRSGGAGGRAAAAGAGYSALSLPLVTVGLSHGLSMVANSSAARARRWRSPSRSGATTGRPSPRARERRC